MLTIAALFLQLSISTPRQSVEDAADLAIEGIESYVSISDLQASPVATLGTPPSEP